MPSAGARSRGPPGARASSLVLTVERDFQRLEHGGVLHQHLPRRRAVVGQVAELENMRARINPQHVVRVPVFLAVDVDETFRGKRDDHVLHSHLPENPAQLVYTRLLADRPPTGRQTRDPDTWITSNGRI